MKFYNNFNEMFTANNSTTCSIFNLTREFQNIITRNKDYLYRGGYEVVADFDSAYYPICMVYDNKYENEEQFTDNGTFQVIALSNSSKTKSLGDKKINLIAVRSACTAIGSLSGVNITSVDSKKGIYCSRPLTDQEAEQVATAIEDSVWDAFYESENNKYETQQQGIHK